MPRPTSSTTLQRPDLGAIAYEYMLEASQRGFIGFSILPIFETPLQSSDYPVLPIEALLGETAQKRAPRGPYSRSDYEFETGTYSCDEYGWEELIDDVESKLYARYFDAEVVAAQRATDIILRSHERRVQTLIDATGTFSNSAVTTEWSTAASCTPRADVTAGKRLMKAASGIAPNTIAISEKVFDNLLLTSELKDALKYTNPIELGDREVQRLLLSKYFGLDVLIGGAIKNSAIKGQSFSLADIWDDEYARLLNVSPGGQQLKEPVIGRTFLWTEDSPEILTTEQYREDATRSDVYRVRHNVDEATIFTGACYLLTNITA